MTPKNYSKKGTICSCLCFISYDSKILEKNIKVVYEVEPNKDRVYSESRHNSLSYSKINTSRDRAYWGKYKRIIELPPIFDKLDDKDFTIKTGYFIRDKVEMPYVISIEINNLQKYQMIKTKEERKNKLDKIASNED